MIRRWRRAILEIALLSSILNFGVSTCQGTVTVEVTVTPVLTPTPSVPEVTVTVIEEEIFPVSSVDPNEPSEVSMADFTPSESSSSTESPTATHIIPLTEPNDLPNLPLAPMAEPTNANVTANPTETAKPEPKLATLSVAGLAVMGFVLLIFLVAILMAVLRKRRDPAAPTSKAREDYLKSLEEGRGGGEKPGNIQTRWDGTSATEEAKKPRGIPNEEMQPVMNIEVMSNPHLRPADRKSVIPEYMRPKKIQPTGNQPRPGPKPKQMINAPPMPKFEVKGKVVYEHAEEDQDEEKKFVYTKIENEDAPKPQPIVDRAGEYRNKNPSYRHQPSHPKPRFANEGFESGPPTATTIDSSHHTYDSDGTSMQTPRYRPQNRTDRDSYSSTETGSTIRSLPKSSPNTSNTERSQSKETTPKRSVDSYDNDSNDSYDQTRPSTSQSQQYPASEWSYKSNTSHNITVNNVPAIPVPPPPPAPQQRRNPPPPAIIIHSPSRKILKMGKAPEQKKSQTSIREKYASPPPPPPPPKDWQSREIRVQIQPGITAAAAASQISMSIPYSTPPSETKSHQSSTMAYQRPVYAANGGIVLSDNESKPKSANAASGGLPRNPRPRRERSKESDWEVDHERGRDIGAQNKRQKSPRGRDLLSERENPALGRY